MIKMEDNKEIVDEIVNDLKEKLSELVSVGEKACWIDAEDCPYQSPCGRLNCASMEWCTQCKKIHHSENLKEITRYGIHEFYDLLKEEIDKMDLRLLKKPT